MCSNIKSLFVLILVFSLSSLHAQEYEVGGYVKYLFSTTTITGMNEHLIDHTLHSRLNVKWYITENITSSLGVRNQILTGDSPERIPNYHLSFGDSTSFLKLGGFLWEKKRTVNYIQCDRFWFDFHYRTLQLSLGKQRIAWGSSLVWNITDLFNPLSILDFDYEERPAVDAIRMQYFTSELSKIDFAYKFSRTREQRTYALQYTLNIAEYDLSALIGYHSERVIVGVNWAGSIAGAGFRGEMTLTQSPRSLNLNPQNSFAQESRPQFSAVLSLDYTFPSSLILHSELLYNNIGKTHASGLSANDARTLGLLSPSRLNAFYRIGYTFTPLLRGDIMLLQNPYDGSHAVLPSFHYSLLENLDASLIALILEGTPLSQYSPRTTMVFLRVMYSF